MDVENFIRQLKELSREIQEKAEVLMGNTRKGFDGMPGLLRSLEGILPEWLFFMEQTGIGSKECIFQVLSDMEEAMQAEDGILMGDALLNGLGIMTDKNIRAIEGALYGE